MCQVNSLGFAQQRLWSWQANGLLGLTVSATCSWAENTLQVDKMFLDNATAVESMRNQGLMCDVFHGFLVEFLLKDVDRCSSTWTSTK
jgi:hypothetical protein